MLEQAANSLTAPNRGVRVHRSFGHRRHDQSVSDSLVVSLQMIVLGKLSDHVAKMSLAQRDDTTQTFGFDRENESLRESGSNLGCVPEAAMDQHRDR